MTIFVLDRAPPGLRGRLTRWMLEVKAGVFVGPLSRRVREKLWGRIREAKIGGSLMIYRAPTEQGFAVELDGDPSRDIVNFEGLLLVKLR